MKVLVQFVPVLLTFGPLAIAKYAGADDFPTYAVALVGGLMTATGNVALFKLLQAQQKDLERLQAHVHEISHRRTDRQDRMNDGSPHQL